MINYTPTILLELVGQEQRYAIFKEGMRDQDCFICFIKYFRVNLYKYCIYYNLDNISEGEID